MNVRKFGAVATAVAAVIATQALVQLAGAAPASALPGLQVVSVASGFDSLASKSITANCPAGKKVVGGGGRVNAAGGKAGVTELSPVTGTIDGFKATGFETDNGFAGTWSIQAYAICANPITGLQVVSKTKAPSSSDFQLEAIGCPTGKRVIGTGARINNPAGQVALQAKGTNNPDATFGSVSAYEDIDGFSGNWGLTAFAICLPNPIAGFSIASASSSWNSDALKIVNVSCPAGTKVHDIMFSTGAGNGDPVLDALVPTNALPTSAQAIVREETGTTENWSVMVQAICAA